MSKANETPRDPELERDPSAELGLRNPVRDKSKLGDTQYSVTPPREEVAPPETGAEHPHAGACQTCQRELDPARSYRIDGEEYVYYFCGENCYASWRRQADAVTPASPRDPGP